MHYDDSFGDDGFGWDGMGDPMGAWHPAWGALAGSSIGTGVSIVLRSTDRPTDLEEGKAPWQWKWAEAFGLGASALLGGAALLYGPARAAGWTALASGFGNHVPRLLEDLLLRYPSDAAKVRTPFRGMGLPSIQRVGRVTGVAGGGTGMPVMERTRAVAGGAEPHLLGRNPRLLGARSIGASSLAGHFGASIAARAA